MSWGDVRIDQEKKKEQLSKVDTGEKVFTKEWVDSHEGGYVAISAIEKYAKQLLKNRGYAKAEITQTPNLEEVAKVTGRIANIAEDYVYTEDGDTACFNKEHFRHEVYPIVLKISGPILATKEHDEELLREFAKWQCKGLGLPEWARDEEVSKFLTSRKEVSKDGEDKE